MMRYPRYQKSPLDKFGPQFTQRDLLGLAWMSEQAALWRQHIGDDVWAKQLFADASALRDAAVNR
jgi:hypothetical protein